MIMLKDDRIVTTIPCSDLEACAVFYKDVLGLKETEYSIPMGVTLEGGPDHNLVYLYPTESSVGDATRFTFVTEDFDSDIADIRSKNIDLLDVAIPEMKIVDRVLIDDESGLKACWFKDPAGNVISLTSAPQNVHLKKTA